MAAKIKFIKLGEHDWNISVNGEIVGSCSRTIAYTTFYKGEINGEQFKAWSQKAIKILIQEKFI